LALVFAVLSAGIVLANTPREAHLATDPAQAAPVPADNGPADNAGDAAAVPAGSQSPQVAALRARLAALSTQGSAEELKERAVVSDFYAARNDSPLWFGNGGPSEQASAIIAEIGRAADWGLDPADFALPQLAPGAALEPAALAEAEVTRRHPVAARDDVGAQFDVIQVRCRVDLPPRVIVEEVAIMVGQSMPADGSEPWHQNLAQSPLGYFSFDLVGEVKVEPHAAWLDLP
jgi:hypothetical protein